MAKMAVDRRVENFLRHYSSQYYDPAKAREYYLRTRELKGRQPTSELSTTQREAWNYTKGQIGESRKRTIESAQSTQASRIESMRATANARSEQIKGKLEQLKAKLDQKRADVDKLEAKLVNDLATKTKLNVIPENATPQQRAFLERANARILANARSEAAKVLTDAREGVAKESESLNEAKSAVSNELKKLGDTLKSSIETSRQEFKKSMETLKAKYEADTEDEYQGIRKNVT